jgi:hypothetical protein
MAKTSEVDESTPRAVDPRSKTFEGQAMKILLTFVAALSFASVGCKKKAAEVTGGDCAKAVSNSMALSKAEMEKAPGMDAAMMQKMQDLGVQHCKDDKRSADAIKCMNDAKTMTDAQGCYGKLTPDQQQKMNQAAMDMAMSQHGGGADSAGSAGSASGSAGSAAGSDGAAAGSGSAAAGSGETESGSAGSAAAPR